MWELYGAYLQVIREVSKNRINMMVYSLALVKCILIKVTCVITPNLLQACINIQNDICTKQVGNITVETNKNNNTCNYYWTIKQVYWYKVLSLFSTHLEVKLAVSLTKTLFKQSFSLYDLLRSGKYGQTSIILS